MRALFGAPWTLARCEVSCYHVGGTPEDIRLIEDGIGTEPLPGMHVDAQSSFRKEASFIGNMRDVPNCGHQSYTDSTPRLVQPS